MKLLSLLVLFCCVLVLLGKPTDNAENIDDVVVEDSDDSRRIFGGSQAPVKKFKYMVALQRKREMGPGYFTFCGGSIIEYNWVLTAAHCCPSFDKGLGGWARAGVNNAADTTPGYQLKEVEKYIIHKDYDAKKHRNDVCLVKLKEPFTPSEFVDKIQYKCTPQKKRGYIIGYGQISQGVSNEDLNAVEVGMQPMKWCSQNIPFVMENEHVCPGEKGKGSCPGDSGSPFVIEDCLRGVAVIAKNPCHTAQASGYASVPFHLPWIEKTLAEN